MRTAVRWGDSEYSEEAECLFADHLSTHAGIGEEFEELCAAHPELADELQGLRADWENVAGIVERLREAEPFPALSAPEPPARERSVSPTGRRLSKGAWSLVALPLLGLGCLVAIAWRARESMAAERGAALASAHALRDELAATRLRLGSVETESVELRAQNLELARSREASELVAGRASALAEALATLQRLRELRDSAERLWPALPERAPEFEAWIATAEELGAGRERDAETARTSAAELSQRLAEVQGLLQSELELLREPGSPLDVLRMRLAVARDPLLGGRPWVVEAWERTRSALESDLLHPGYAGLEIRPQRGLLPLGDQGDGLLNFLHLPTFVGLIDLEAGGLGAVPLEGALVLRLVPGRPHPAPGAAPVEEREQAPAEGEGGPIAPFLLSKDPLPAWLLLRLHASAPELGAGGLEELDSSLQRLGLAIATPTELGWARALGAIPPRAARAPDLYLSRALEP